MFALPGKRFACKQSAVRSYNHFQEGVHVYKSILLAYELLSFNELLNLVVKTNNE